MPLKVPKRKISTRMLFIADTHIPATHQDYLPFCMAAADTYDLQTVAHVGDVVDWNAISYHEKDPDLPSAGDELEMIREQIKPWFEAFPEMYISEGNHGALPKRKMKTAGLPRAFLRDVNELYGTPKTWRWVTDYIQYTLECGMPLVQQHDFAASFNAGKLNLGSASVVQGHRHSLAGVVWNTDVSYRRFFMPVGCGTDPDHPAFSYGKNGIKNIMAHGCGIVIDGAAYHIPMFLDDNGRWNGKVP